MAASLLAVTALALTSCDPAIARRKGVVAVVRPVDDSPGEVEVCLLNTVDAGSTYGDKSPSRGECLAGVPDGSIPKPRDCVVLQIQGESSMLWIEPADGC